MNLSWFSGRVDLKQKIDFCTEEQALRMFKIHNPESSNEEAQEFVEKFQIKSQKVSAAKLQNILMLELDFRSLTEDAVNELIK